MMEMLTKKTILLISVSLIILLVLIATATFLLSQQTRQTKPPQFVPIKNSQSEISDKQKQLTEKISGLPQSAVIPTPKPLPQLSIESYQNKSELPLLPDNINYYDLKTDYSLEEALIFGQKFGLNQHKLDNNGYAIIYSTEENNAGILSFNLKTGSYTFESYGSHKPKTAISDDPIKIAYYFLRENKIIDNTILCNNAYRNQQLSELTFVECHRDWSKVGLPILNYLGLLNIEENKKLSQIKLGETDNSSANDLNITETNIGLKGKARPNDFNTVTVAVASDNKIVWIDSNIRQILTTSTTLSSNLHTPQEAWEGFKAHKSQLSLTIPSGSGNLNFNKVYQGNKIQVKKAAVTDYLLTYVENPPSVSQNNLVPMYVIRGLAELDSGYKVRFVETVPALKSGLSFLNPNKNNVNTQGQVAGVMADNSQQLLLYGGPLTPTVTLTPTSTPTPRPPQGGASLPTATPTREPSDCTPPEDELDPVYELPDNLGKLGFASYLEEEYLTLVPTQLRDRAVYCYYVRPAGSPASPKEEYVRQVYNAIDKFITEKKNANERKFMSQEIRLFQRIQTEWKRSKGKCPIRVTGPSPSLFVYLEKNSRIKIAINTLLTYSDPLAINNNIFEVETDANNQIKINDFARDFIYYEYPTSQVIFDQPRYGWKTTKKNLEKLAREIISPSLKLTTTEENRLIVELNLAALDLKSEKLLVGLIDQKELDKKISLTVAIPASNIFRYHFLIKIDDNKTIINPPNLSPIPRFKSLIVELGARAKN